MIKAIDPAKPREPTPATIDRARLIRRCVRCFVFGIFGAIPFFGLGLAWVALRVQRQVARETGDKIEFRLLCLVSIFCLELVALFLRLDLEFLSWLSAFMALTAPLLIMRSQYYRVRPPQWNPARRLLYWGAALSYSGAVLTAIGVIIVWKLFSIF